MTSDKVAEGILLILAIVFLALASFCFWTAFQSGMPWPFLAGILSSLLAYIGFRASLLKHYLLIDYK